MKSKAVFFTGNKNAEVREIDVPDPGNDEIQVKTISNGICMFEVWLYNNKNDNSAELVGHEGIGVVTKVGHNVKEVKEGDYVSTSKWSEYTNIHRADIIKASCKHQDAELHIIEPVSCAVNAVSHMNIYPGEKAIVFGAGYMGLLLIQLLKHSPLSELVVVDMKDSNLELAFRYGATRVINLAKGGEKELEEMEAQAFDLCYEASGARSALEECTRLTRAGGKIGIYSWHHEPRRIDTSEWHVKGLHVLNVSPAMNANQREGMAFKAADRLMSAGKVRQDELLTHSYTLEEIQQAMGESTKREGNFIKSFLRF